MATANISVLQGKIAKKEADPETLVQERYVEFGLKTLEHLTPRLLKKRIEPGWMISQVSDQSLPLAMAIIFEPSFNYDSFEQVC